MAFGLKKDCKETINPNIARWDLNWKIWQHAESHFYQFSCFRFLLCTCDSTDVSLITSVVKIVVACFMSLSVIQFSKKVSLNINVHNWWFHVFTYYMIQRILSLEVSISILNSFWMFFYLFLQRFGLTHRKSFS